uniref:DH domain-containing protein n=1 Tax=Ascaris lumbricoides TaxID=6252 RepID=A0A9J2PJP7_ASCLU
MEADTSIITSDVVDMGSYEDADMSRGVARSASQVKRIERACLVGAARNDRYIVELLGNHFAVELLESASGIEYKDDPNVVFVCTDFINCPHFKYLHSCGTLIIGPAIIKLRAKQSKPLLMPRPNRPLYTDSMVGVSIVLSGVSGKQCREAVDLVHFMGGSARKKFSASTTHLITDAAKGKTYRINQFLVEPFCGLRIWFVAYHDEELNDMRQKTIEHKGKLASSQQEATHIVVSNSPDATVEDFDQKQHLVSGEWFWLSIQLNCCANEEIYQWKGHKRANRKRAAFSSPRSEQPAHSSRRTLSRSSLDNLETSNSSAVADYSEHLFSAEDLEKLPSSPRRVDKRHAVCKEMLETEENYLKALKIIVQTFKEPLEALAHDPESGLLSKAEIMQIFSRVPSLVEVHEKICNELRTYVMHWSTDRLIGKIWLDYAEYLRPVYKAFINSYDTAAAESRAECQRNNLRDLLVRPVQRLPSVLLLLKAIQKKTERSNPDNSCLTKALRALEDVLATANESRRQTESYAEIFRVSNEIDRCPPEILSSARTLTSELHVLSLGGEDEWAKTRGRNMAIFLFNDLIEIAKVRSGTTTDSPTRRISTQAFTRQISFSSFRHEKKKYKHHQQYMLTSIRQIDIISHSDFEGVFVLSFRVSQGEDFWVAQCLENQPGEMRKFLKDLSTQIFYLCGRITLMDDMNLDSEPSSDTIVTIRKALHHAVRKCSSQAPSSVRPPSQFRRAVSSMQIGISNTLSRFHSRSNLRAINESTPISHYTTVGASATPSRRYKQMLSTSTFLPSLLGRRESMRASINTSHI